MFFKCSLFGGGRVRTPMKAHALGQKNGRCQTACKPGSVRPQKGRGRSFLWDPPCSGPHATNPSDGAKEPLKPLRVSAAPIRSCSRWGLPCLLRYRRSGALLPHRFTLTFSAVPRFPTGQNPEGGLFSVALSLRSPSPVVNRHRSSVEPGLSSPLQSKAATVQPSGVRTLLPEPEQVKRKHTLHHCPL